MASSTPAGAAAGNSLSAIAAKILDLEDSLVVQRTILMSLLDQPQDANSRDEVTRTKAEIARIKEQLVAARRQRQQGTTASGKVVVDGSSGSSDTPTSSTMDTPSTGSFFWEQSAGPSSMLSRKRSFGTSQLGSGHITLPDTKSHRATPSPAASGITTPSFSTHPSFSDDIEVVDLTGDDDEYTTNLIKEQEDRFVRNKLAADNDAKLARELHENGGFGDFPSPATWQGAANRQAGQTEHSAFDRMLPRASQPPRPSETVTLSPRPSEPHGLVYPSHAGSSNVVFSSWPQALSTWHPPAAQQQNFQIPGAFPESDAVGFTNDDQHISHAPPIPLRPAHPGWQSGGNPVSFYPGIPAVELARRAAQARQSNAQSSNLGSYGNLREGNGYTPVYGASSINVNPSQTLGLVPSFPPQSSYGSVLPNPQQTSPFRNLIDLTNDSLSNVINRTRSYNIDNWTDSFGNALDSRWSSYISDTIDDPRKTEEEIQELLTNIRPDMDIPVEERGQTPDALKYPLYTHQQLALKWMSDNEEGSNKGGILADDMGLGKTISTLALMVTRKPSDNVKTNLIVGPVALIKQWENEIHKKLKRDHRMTVCSIHGKKMSYANMKNYDVILTTYGTIAQEWKRYDQHVKVRQDCEGYNVMDDTQLQTFCPVLHPKSKFFRVILDEAQCIKNKDAQAAKAAHMIMATYRWCLTGTPMMNSVAELFPLIRFLRIRPYCDQKQFQRAFSSLSTRGPQSEYKRDSAMNQLRVVLKSIMLRRMKNSQIDGQPILRLPDKTEITEQVEFSEDEQLFYTDLETKSQVRFNKYLRAGTVGKNYSNILVLLLRLRQACCHPHLNMDVDHVGLAEVPLDTMALLAKSLDQQVVARIKAIEAFECPICYDAVEDPTFVIPCGHDTCSECFASLTDRASANNIRSGHESGSAKCPQCRGPVDPRKVISYTAFKSVHMPETLEGNNDSDDEDEDDDDEDLSADDSETASEADEDESDDEADEVDEVGNLRDFIVPDDEVDENDQGRESELEDVKHDDGETKAKNEEDEDEFPDLLKDAAQKQSGRAANKDDPEEEPRSMKAIIKGRRNKMKKSKKSKKDKKGKKKAEAKADDVQPHMLQLLRKEASKNMEARRRYMAFLKKDWKPSAKVTKVMEILRDIEPSGEKTIVFSQWTSLLDLLEIPIKHELGLPYCRYDGGMSRAQRDAAIADFIDNPLNKVMLVSLRAGNAGLNLTAASHIVICDPFWNPYIEMQAVDRAHRIGQQREVKVHRVLVPETVEDRIVDLQERKRKLVDAALDEGESKNLGRLTVQELGYLFGVSTR